MARWFEQYKPLYEVEIRHPQQDNWALGFVVEAQDGGVVVQPVATTLTSIAPPTVRIRKQSDIRHYDNPGKPLARWRAHAHRYTLNGRHRDAEPMLRIISNGLGYNIDIALRREPGERLIKAMELAGCTVIWSRKED